MAPADPSVAEAAGAAAAGAVLGGAVGSFVGLAPVGAVVGGLNGWVSGARRVYDWGSSRGVVAFVLDSTWALGTTAGGLVCHAVARLQRDAGYADDLSRRQNRHVYSRGFRVRRGFAITIGNVVNGGGDLTRARRRKLVTDHEDVHIWQSRMFGPAYPVLYGGWMAGAGLAAAVAWPFGRGEIALTKYVETLAYYLNPFEWWAYSRDAHWPPSGKAPGIGWQRPLVPSFASCVST